MRRIFLLVCLFSGTFLQNGIAQVTPVVNPVMTLPKLTIPASFAGKIKLVDSLQKAKAPDGAILKAFLPQYAAQFQQQLIENLLLLDQASMDNGNVWFSRRVPELITTVRREYPEITRPVIYKIFYAFCYSKKPSFFDLFWPWDMEKALNISYGQNAGDNTAPKYLKEANLGMDVVFSYYAYKTTLFTDPWVTSGMPNYSPEEFQGLTVKSTVYKFLSGGFSPAEIYDAMRRGGYRSDYWLIGYCFANSLYGTPVETVARILKKDYITDTELVRILGQSSDYKKQENILKALQAN
ncbi:MAG: hypothetical protein HZA79_15855 [Sphingobacteriales bacterium]|nr:hypothetical protein [Sphingobacteriales bacterium]